MVCYLIMWVKRKLEWMFLMGKQMFGILACKMCFYSRNALEKRNLFFMLKSDCYCQIGLPNKLLIYHKNGILTGMFVYLCRLADQSLRNSLGECSIPYKDLQFDDVIRVGRHHTISKGRWHGEVMIHTYR